MKEDEEIREEQVFKKLTTKTIYNFVDTKNKINRKSREVFKKSDKITYFPFGFNGKDKYKNIKKIHLVDFEGEVPRGIYSSAKRGWGFTKVLKPLADYFDGVLKLNEVTLIWDGTSKLDKSKKTMVLNSDDLDKLFVVCKTMMDTHKEELSKITVEELSKIFSRQITAPKKKYIKNTIATALRKWDQKLTEFSDDDKNEVKSLFDRLMLTDDFLTPESLIETKTKVDHTYIEDVLEKYEELLGRTTKTENLEKNWQRLLSEHNWLFSYFFSYPIMLFKDEAYVGGKTLSNKDGKVTDFIVTNSLTKNVAFVEIKTHLSALTGGTPYRGSNIYSISTELTGAINQVLMQKDEFQKEYAQNLRKSMEVDGEQFRAFNSKCMVLAGSIDDLENSQIGSFELFRNNCKDVDIVTFDELYKRLESLYQLMQGKLPGKSKS